MENKDFKSLVREQEASTLTSSYKKVKIALLSSYTINNIGDSLKYYLYTNQFNPNIKYGGYNQFNQELLDSTSWLYSFNPDVIVLSLSTETLFPELYYDVLSKPYAEVLKECTLKIKTILNSLKQCTLSSKVILTTLNESVPSPYGIRDYQMKEGVQSIISQCNSLISSYALEDQRVLLFNMEKFVSLVGYEKLTDNKLFYLGQVFLSNYAAQRYSESLITFINAIYGNVKKCIVVDLDNTLWGGVIGEDGLDNIKLGDSAIGNVYKKVQKILLNYKRLGVLLAIVSKNNEEDVFPVFEKREDMLLKKSDFVSVKINWEKKSKNIEEIAKELNLGVDSFVFLDDSPLERLEVKSKLPQVEVINFPKDVADLPSILLTLPFFEKITLTDEDTKRHKMYMEEKKRSTLKQAVAVGDYLKELDITIKVKRDDIDSIDRITQLTNKTNQFNLRTQRYTKEEVQHMFDSDSYTIFSVQVSDKFGDLGLTGVIIFKEVSENTFFIDTFLMSCRVLARDIEKQFFKEAINHFSDGAKLEAEYLKTPKNSQVANFLEKLHFSVVKNGEQNKTYGMILDKNILENVRWIKVN